MIKLEHVSKTYEKGVQAITDVNLHIAPGEFVFIVGKSGSGKSTLLKLLQKELAPTHGKIFVNKRDIGNISRKNIPAYRRNIGVVFQNFRLLQDRSVYENVAFAMRVVEAPKRDIKKKVPQMLSLVGLAAPHRRVLWDKNGTSQPNQPKKASEAPSF